MLGVNIAVATVVLAMVAGVYSAPRNRIRLFHGLLLMMLALILFQLGGLVVLLQGLALGVIWLVARIAGAAPKVFLVAGAVATICIILGIGVWGIVAANRYQAQYPVESLAARLATDKRPEVALSPTLDRPAIDAQEMERLSTLYEERGWRASQREAALRHVHASQFEKFVSSPGFGVGRGPAPGFWILNSLTTHAPAGPIPIGDNSAAPLPAKSEQQEAAAPGAPTSAPWRSQLTPLHEDSMVEFANPESFGWVRDLEHVIGFQPHAIRVPSLTPLAASLKLRRVELVSILKHDPPQAYISANLPNMDELKLVPVRPLDPFEMRSLAKLREGSELESEEFPGRVRAMGAIIAVRQCVQCHAVVPGELLGAFSYDLDIANDPAEANPAEAAPNQQQQPEPPL